MSALCGEQQKGTHGESVEKKKKKTSAVCVPETLWPRVVSFAGGGRGGTLPGVNTVSSGQGQDTD